MLKSVEDIETFMQTNLMIVAEMIRKLGKSSNDSGLIHSAIEAFIVFCKRQYQKGKDWISELELENPLQSYFISKRKSVKWEEFTQLKETKKKI